MSQNSSRREAMRAQQQAEEAAARRRKIVGIVSGVLVIAIIAAVVIWAVNRDKGSEEATGPQVKPPSATGSAHAYVVNKGKAKKGAPVLKVYEDFQCPVCKQVEDIFGKKFEALAASGDIELQWQTLTFLDDNMPGESSQRAAVAAACADTVGKIAPYHDVVFAHQPEEGTGYTDDQLRGAFAKDAGITGADLTKFQKCYDTKATKDFATNAAEEGLKEGMKLEKKFGTPFMTVDGKPWNDWTNLAEANQNQLLDAIKKAAK